MKQLVFMQRVQCLTLRWYSNPKLHIFRAFTHHYSVDNPDIDMNWHTTYSITAGVGCVWQCVLESLVSEICKWKKKCCFAYHGKICCPSPVLYLRDKRMGITSLQRKVKHINRYKFPLASVQFLTQVRQDE